MKDGNFFLSVRHYMSIIVESKVNIFWSLITHDSHTLTIVLSTLNLFVYRCPQHEVCSARFEENWQNERVLWILNFFKVDKECFSVSHKLLNKSLSKATQVIINKFFLQIFLILLDKNFSFCLIFGWEKFKISDVKTFLCHLFCLVI